MDRVSETGSADRLLGRGSTRITRVRASHLHVTHGGGPVQFSLDGGMLAADELTVDSRRGAIRFHVGDGYGPDPEEWSGTKPM